MKLSIVSDLHLDFAPYSIPVHEADVRINAGDTIENVEGQRFVARSFDVTVKGNHDYYRSNFPRKEADVGTFEKDGVKFAYATLWTDLENMDDWWRFERGLVDQRLIRGLTREAYLAKHLFDLHFLKNSGADVIVTHHSPFLQSCHPKYANSGINASFHSDYAEYVAREFKVTPKLWIHGHTHDPCDYVMPYGTRVVCHPRGYPGETLHRHYEPLLLDI